MAKKLLTKFKNRHKLLLDRFSQYKIQLYTKFIFMSTEIRISPSTASLLFGISERSIRRAISNGELPVLVKNARYKIEIRDLLRWSEKLPNRQKKRDNYGIGQYVDTWRI